MNIPYTLFRNCSISEIDNLLVALTPKEQKQLKRDVAKEIRTKSRTLNESQRIALVKLLLWALPGSEKEIYSLLKKTKDRKDFEIHFTIFAFLDQALDGIKNVRLRQRLLNATKNYLATVTRDYAHGAWMAGEFLGAHTNEKIALPILKSAYSEAHHAPGKEAVLFGLYRIAERTNNKSLYRIIKSASEIEGDRSVRACAKNLLERLDERQKTLVI